MLQSIDSTIDNGIFTYPITLGHKDNILTETTYIDEINKLEDPHTTIEVYSKLYASYI